MITLLFRLFRYSKFILAEKKFSIALLFFSMWAYATTGFMYFEMAAKPDLDWATASWWSIVTMTTVGYGDYFPVTKWGQILVGYPTMLLGVSILGYLLSIMASSILESKLRELKGMTNIDFEDHIVICRYHGVERMLRLASEIKKDQSTQGSELVLIDENLVELPQELVEAGIHFVKGRASRDSVLERANFKHARCLFILANRKDPEHSDHHNLALALTVKRMEKRVFTVVECVDPENVIFLKRAGCDSVVCTKSLSGQMMVQELQDPGVHRIIEELTSNQHGHQFYLSKIPKDLASLNDLKSHYQKMGVVFVGVQRDQTTHYASDDSFDLKAGDQAITIGSERPA